MGSVAYQFGSYLFTGTNALVSDIDIKSANRVRQQTIPYNDGAYIDEALLSPLAISFKGTLVGATQADMRTVKDNFLNAVCDGTQKLFIWDDRYIIAQKRNLQYDYRAMLTFMPFSVSFIAATPFWVASTASQDLETTAVAGDTFSHEVNTIGSAYAKPTITIMAYAALSYISLENTTTDEKLSFSGTVLSSAALVIDCDAGTVTNSSANAIADFSGEFLRVINGTNTLEYTGLDCGITYDWSERWY